MLYEPSLHRLVPLTLAEIDLAALAHNCRELRHLTSPSAKIMAVLKANGYGHGASEAAKASLNNGAEYLAVAEISEAFDLRETGITAPILLLGYSRPCNVEYMVRNEIRPSVSTFTSAEMISMEGTRLNKKVKIHIKVDTGMGRLGIVCDELVLPDSSKACRREVVGTILKIASLPGLDIEGIYTHFANSDRADKSHARRQFAMFTDILDDLKKHGCEIRFRHAANSAAVIDMPETHLDIVRPGILLYGLWPSDEVDKSRIDLKPVMTIKSAVIQVKQVPAGFKVSYGSTYETTKRTSIATVPIGYADGYSRSLSSRGFMLVHGQRAPIIGRVCMDMALIDVTHIPDVSIEDEVMVLGKQGNEEVTADEIARLANTINYEIVSTVTARVPRIYKKEHVISPTRSIPVPA
jgi:alanine racemase